MEVTDIIVTKENDYKFVKLGEREAAVTDAGAIHVFTPNGIFLGEVPLEGQLRGMKIFGSRLFLIDSFNMVVLEYRIVD